MAFELPALPGKREPVYHHIPFDLFRKAFRMFRQCCDRWLLLALLLALPACGASSSQALDSGQGKSNPDTGPAVDPLFSSPDVPRCQNNFTEQYQLIGRIGEEDVRVGSGVISNLTPKGFDILPGLSLTWTAPIAEDVVVDLVGLSIMVPKGHSLAGEDLCITSGRFGSPSMKPTDEGRQLLFTITGALRGGCSGTPIPISLGGCVLHTNKYFPNTVPKNDASATRG